MVLLTGCEKRGEECQRFIGTVNRTLREIDARSQPKPDDLKAVAAHRGELAKKYRSLANEVLALSLTEPELISRAERYSELAKAAADALTDGVKAVKAQNPKQADLSQERFDRVAKAESELVVEINSLCLGEASAE
jgi:hypothetical protein